METKMKISDIRGYEDMGLRGNGAGIAMVLSTLLLKDLMLSGYKKNIISLSDKFDKSTMKTLIGISKDFIADFIGIDIRELPEPKTIPLLYIGTYLGLDADDVNKYIEETYTKGEMNRYNGFKDAFDALMESYDDNPYLPKSSTDKSEDKPVGYTNLKLETDIDLDLDITKEKLKCILLTSIDNITLDKFDMDHFLEIIKIKTNIALKGYRDGVQQTKE